MSAEILQEFVAKLGYHVDEASGKRMSAGLTKMGGAVGVLGKQMVGLAVSAEQAIREFAMQMERVGYSAKLADTTATSLTGASQAAQKFGLQAGQIEGITAAFANLIRHSPGVEAQLNQLGVALDPDKIKEFFSLMERLETMPENIALQYAQAFQIPADAYHLMRGHVSEIRADMEQMADKAKAIGYNMKDASERGREYSNSISNIKNNVNLLAAKTLDLGLQAALPILKDFDLTLGSIFVTEEKRQEMRDKEAQEINEQRNRGIVAKPANEEEAHRAIDKALEKQFGLPSGMLTGIVQQETRGGKPQYGRSTAGAEGPFQLMPQTQQQYGVKNPYDYAEAAMGAAKLMHDMMLRYKNESTLALASYNAGPGAVDRYLAGKGGLPAETQAYIPGVVRRSPRGSEMAMVNPTVIMNFQGSADPDKVRAAAEQGVRRAADAVNQKATARIMASQNVQ